MDTLYAIINEKGEYLSWQKVNQFRWDRAVWISPAQLGEIEHIRHSAFMFSPSKTFIQFAAMKVGAAYYTDQYRAIPVDFQTALRHDEKAKRVMDIEIAIDDGEFLLDGTGVLFSDFFRVFVALASVDFGDTVAFTNLTPMMELLIKLLGVWGIIRIYSPMTNDNPVVVAESTWIAPLFIDRVAAVINQHKDAILSAFEQVSISRQGENLMVDGQAYSMEDVIWHLERNGGNQRLAPDLRNKLIELHVLDPNGNEDINFERFQERVSPLKVRPLSDFGL